MSNPFDPWEYRLPPPRKVTASEYRIHLFIEPEQTERYEISILNECMLMSFEVDDKNPLFPSRYVSLDSFRIKHDNVREELVLSPVPMVVMIGYSFSHRASKGKTVELTYKNHGKNRELVDLRLKVIEIRV